MGDALSTGIGMVVAFRALTGLTVASQSLNPAIVGDMFVQEERGRPMAMMEVAPFIGVIAGPILGGYIVCQSHIFFVRPRYGFHFITKKTNSHNRQRLWDGGGHSGW